MIYVHFTRYKLCHRRPPNPPLTHFAPPTNSYSQPVAPSQISKTIKQLLASKHNTEQKSIKEFTAKNVRKTKDKQKFTQ